MRIKFERALRAEPRGATPQRLAAARRAIEKDRENNALTPELVKPYNSDPETRIENADNRYLFVARALRKHDADCWRKGRRMLQELTPEMREKCIRLWNREAYPLTGTYFCTHVRRCLERPQEINEFLAFLERRRETDSLDDSAPNSGTQLDDHSGCGSKDQSDRQVEGNPSPGNLQYLRVDA